MTDQFTYISAFLSIVVALALTHLLAGIASILRVRVLHFSWRLAAWIGIYLFACVDYWFSIWGLHNEASWTLGYTIYLLGLATLLYVGCHLVMPRVGPDDEEVDLAAFEESDRRRFLTAFGIYMAMAATVNLTISGFAEAVWINLVAIALVALAWFWRDARVQWFVVLALTAVFTYYAITFIPAI